MAFIEVRNLTKKYGYNSTAVNALRGISLSVEKSEILSIMGKSGSGKSTFLQLIGGLDIPNSGRIIIDGVEITKQSNEKDLSLYRKKNIGYVFQFFNLLSSLTVEENIALPLLLSNSSEIEKRTRQLLYLVDLYDRRSHYPKELSGGQQQRVAIARALVLNPPLLLADEPTGNLDSKSTLSILNLLIQTRDKYDQSIVVVTHDPSVASFSDRVLFFNDGLIVNEHINKNSFSKEKNSLIIAEKFLRIQN